MEKSNHFLKCEQTWCVFGRFGKVANKDRDTCNEMNRLYKHYKEHGELNLMCYCKWKGHEPCHGDVIKNMLESALRKSADS